MLTPEEFALRMTNIVKEFAPGPLGKVTSGVGRGEGAVLMVIYHSDVPLCPGDIAKTLRFTTNRVANSLKRLGDKGYLDFVPQSEDKRKHVVALTEKGRLFAEEETAMIVAECGVLLEEIGEEDALALLTILERIVAKKKEKGCRCHKDR